VVIKYFKDYIESINEGLIKTLPANIVLKNILNVLTNINISVNGQIIDNKIELLIKDFNLIPLNQIENIFDIIDSNIVNRGGWFPSSINYNNLSGLSKIERYSFLNIIQFHTNYSSIKITYESKFDLEVDIPDKLYHLTIEEYIKKINKFGLVPKSKSKLSSHLDRIYVCKDLDSCKLLIPEMMYYYTGEKDENVYKLGKKLFNKNLNPIIYEIDNQDHFIKKMYQDPNYEGGYFILENILPSKLKIVFHKK